jgi:hypothetical protein
MLKPAVMGGREIQCMTERDNFMLNTWGWKILRRVYRPIAE